MAKGPRITQNDLRKIRSELSDELQKMKPYQRKEYLEAARDVYNGLSKMVRIRQLVKL